MALPTLPPAPSPIPIAYEIEEAKASYLAEYFLAMRKDGMNRHQFAKWRILKEAYEWWTQKCLTEANEIRRAARQADAAEAEALKTNA